MSQPAAHADRLAILLTFASVCTGSGLGYRQILQKNWRPLGAQAKLLRRGSEDDNAIEPLDYLRLSNDLAINGRNNLLLCRE